MGYIAPGTNGSATPPACVRLTGHVVAPRHGATEQTMLLLRDISHFLGRDSWDFGGGGELFGKGIDFKIIVFLLRGNCFRIESERRGL